MLIPGSNAANFWDDHRHCRRRRCYRRRRHRRRPHHRRRRRSCRRGHCHRRQRPAENCENMNVKNLEFLHCGFNFLYHKQ